MSNKQARYKRITKNILSLCLELSYSDKVNGANRSVAAWRVHPRLLRLVDTRPATSGSPGITCDATIGMR